MEILELSGSLSEKLGQLNQSWYVLDIPTAFYTDERFQNSIFTCMQLEYYRAEQDDTVVAPALVCCVLGSTYRVGAAIVFDFYPLLSSWRFLYTTKLTTDEDHHRNHHTPWFGETSFLVN